MALNCCLIYIHSLLCNTNRIIHFLRFLIVKIGTILLGVIVFCLAMPLAAEEAEVRFGFGGLYLYGFIPSGASVRLGIYRIQLLGASKASMELKLGGGLLRAFHYQGADGTPYSVPGKYNSKLTYTGDRINIEYAIRFANNFSPSADYILSPFIAFRGHSAPELHKEPLPVWDDGEEGNFRHEFLGGLEYSTVTRTDDIFALRRGNSAELSLGYAINSAPRISLESKSYSEIASLDVMVFEIRGRLLADYLFAGARYDDYSFFGGSSMKSGLGGVVRGFEARSYATPLKLALNGELHLIFAPFEDVAINPGLFIFADGGIYSGEPLVQTGALLSAGVGISLDILHFLVLTARLNLPVIGARLDGRITTFSVGLIHF